MGRTDIMKEYRKVPSLDFNYEISVEGTLRNVKSKKVLKAPLDNGYKRVSLRIKGVQKNYRIHRLVAECWHKQFDNDKVVHHIDGNPLNNHVSNLAMLTVAEHNREHPEVLEKMCDINKKDGYKKQRKTIKLAWEKISKPIYTMHNGQELEFRNSAEAAEWVKKNYSYKGTLESLGVNIRRSARGEYKGIMYKHKWYRK